MLSGGGGVYRSSPRRRGSGRAGRRFEHHRQRFRIPARAGMTGTASDFGHATGVLWPVGRELRLTHYAVNSDGAFRTTVVPSASVTA